MADEILIVDNTVEEIEVEEFNGVPTGAIITTTHGYGKGEQHSIEDVTGLKTKLENIEKLKPVRSNLSGHADYYLWGDTEDIGPGYFVRLGEDGMIHKCANETIVIRPKDLPLDTDENGNVIIYALVGNITTADITKYYVVGTEAPYDIYAYDGVEYVQKSAYSYDGEQVIKTCHTTDILGVTVDAAGFIGNDENIINTCTSAKATDINYALVATTGVVDVLCGHDIVVGDYVFPTVSGQAAKSTGSYGYLVTALVQNGVVVQKVDEQEILYARIVLSQSMVNTKKVSDNVDYLLGETKRLDENITTFGNTAETALKRAEELTEMAKNSANEASNNAQNAVDAATGAQKAVENMTISNSNTAEIAQQASKDAEKAIKTANSIKAAAIEEANKTAVEVAQGNMEFVKALEYRLDEYTVGQYSQAYGLTYEQAKAILPVGTVFIPMDEDPTAGNATQTYKEVYANKEADVEQIFTVGYSYVWGGENWLVDKTVLITRTPTTQTEGDYWFVVKEYDGNEYNCGSLYRWEDGSWKEVAVRKENVMNRTMAHLYHSDDTIRQSVSTVDKKVAVVETKVDETDARVGLVASVPTELVGVKPANYNGDTETIDIINDKTDLETNWTEHAITKGDGTHYYVVGQQLPYDVYTCLVDGNVVTFTNSNTITYDGVNFYKINIASILTSANEDGSGVQLNANKIQFNGHGIFQDENGNITQIDGSYITTGKISTNVMSASEIIGAINRDDEDDQTDLKIRADRISINGADISLTGKTIKISADDCFGIESEQLTVDKDGNATFKGKLEAAQGDFTGKITATDGKIGGCTINTDGSIVSANNKFQVNADGSVEAKDITLTGTGDGVKNLIDSKYFKVTQDGKIEAEEGKIGNTVLNTTDFDIYSSNGVFSVNKNGSVLASSIRIGTEQTGISVSEEQINSSDNTWILDSKGFTFNKNATFSLGGINFNSASREIFSSGTDLKIHNNNLSSIKLNYNTGGDKLEHTLTCDYYTDNSDYQRRISITFKSSPAFKFYTDGYIDITAHVFEHGLFADNYNNSAKKSFSFNAGSDTSTTITFNSIAADLSYGEIEWSFNIYIGGTFIRNISVTHGYGASAKPGKGTIVLPVTYSETVHNDGFIEIQGSIYPTETEKYSFGKSGGLWDIVWAKTGTIQTSDRQEKNSIKLITEQYDNVFDKLLPVSYKFNNNTSNRTHIGFIAQDVEVAILDAGLTTQDFAGICYWDKEDGTRGYGLRYSEFIALCVDQIQKLKTRVSELEDKLNTQQND